MNSSDYRRIARDRLTGNWWLSIGMAAVACMLGGLMVGTSFLASLEVKLQEIDTTDIMELANGTIRFGLHGGSFFALVQFLLGGTVQLGYCKFVLAQFDRRELNFSDLFSEFERFGIGFAQHFLRGLYVFLWSLLLVIPGIIADLSYAMTPYLLTDNPSLSAAEAISCSKRIMDGHKFDLFCLRLSFIGWDLLCVLTMNLGHLALNPYKNAAEAAFYRDLMEQVRRVQAQG